MKVVLVSLADNRCSKGQQKVEDTGLRLGNVSRAVSWTWNQFRETEHYTRHRSLFTEKRGLGYWGWKPFLILDEFSKIDDGDVVLYHDAGRPCYDWRIEYDVNPLVEHVVKHHRGLGIVFGPWNHGKMTKRDCFVKMRCDQPEYHRHRQVSATWGIFQKNAFCREVLEEWRDWIVDPSRIVTDDVSAVEEHDFYQHHRHDQSILTNILIRKILNKEYTAMKHVGYEKNINNILKLHTPAQPADADAACPVCLRDDVYIFYDLFIDSDSKIVGIGPYYPERVDYARVELHFKNKTVAPTVVGDNHKHTNIMTFDVRCAAQERISIAYDGSVIFTATLRRPTYTPRKLVASTMFKNCSPFLETWLVYHRHIGVEHFYLYNNNSSEEDMAAVRQVCDKFPGLTTVIDWPYPYKSPVKYHSPSAQTTQQNTTLYKYSEHSWVLLTDLDEYIFSETSSLLEVIDRYGDVQDDISGLTIPCMWFGCSMNADYGDDFLHKLVYRKQAANSCRPGGGPKMLARPKNCRVYSVHRCIQGKREIYMDPSLLRFNHYFSLTNDSSRYKLIASAVRRKGKNTCNCKELDVVRDTGVSDLYASIEAAARRPRFVFVSIPKNASQSVHKMFGTRLKDHSSDDDIGICDNHCRCAVLKRRYPSFDSRFKFCFVRNPWERLVSWFRYHVQVIPMYKKYTFESWARAGFPHHWGLQNGTRYRKERRSPLDQHQFIYDDEGNLMVDFVGHMETFPEDFAHVCKTIGLEQPPMEHRNSTGPSDWRCHYNPATFDLVKARFRRDIELFGYQDVTL